MIAAPPYALHCAPGVAPSLAKSQLSAILSPAGFRGTPSTSPRVGVTMRQRQSSVTTDTQYPAGSNGAAACGVGAAGTAGAPPCWAAIVWSMIAPTTVATAAAMIK